MIEISQKTDKICAILFRTRELLYIGEKQNKTNFIVYPTGHDLATTNEKF